MLIKIYNTFDVPAFHFSDPVPDQVPNMLRQTYPESQRLGLNLNVLLPVVSNYILGGSVGKSSL